MSNPHKIGYLGSSPRGSTNNNAIFYYRNKKENENEKSDPRIYRHSERRAFAATTEQRNGNDSSCQVVAASEMNKKFIIHSAVMSVGFIIGSMFFGGVNAQTALYGVIFTIGSMLTALRLSWLK